MQQYLELMRRIRDEGDYKDDRTHTGTLNIFGASMRFDLSQGFPLLTTKKLHWKSIVYELLWFLKGDTNIKYLNEHGVTIWDEWADPKGDLGPIYGKQWRLWHAPDGTTIDQIQWVITEIRSNPNSRRLVVNSWNVADLPQMKLLPCHVLFQFDVTDGKLSCLLYQRSADFFLGVPFNIASYALLTMIVAMLTGLEPGEFIHNIGSAHLYVTHLEQVNTQLARTPRQLPRLVITPCNRVEDLVYEDFKLEGYDAYPNIPAKVAV